jgi:gliding motility-associated-like protein
MRNRYFHSYLFFLLVCCSTAFSQSITFQSTNASCNGASDGKIKVIMNSYPTPYAYSWSTGQTTQTATGLAAGSYTVVITYGPNSLDTTLVFPLPEGTCPMSAEQTFTPNGDGINDTWNVYNSQYYPDYLIIVYNRWGQKVFESKNTYVPWDGDQLNTPLPVATYYYIIYPYGRNSEEGMVKGDVTIVR